MKMESEESIRFRGLGGLDQGQLVAGPWGDLSPHFHQLLQCFAESRVAALSRAQGWEAGPGQLGKVTGEIRRAMSVTVVRANAECLLERLSQLGKAHWSWRIGGGKILQAFDLAWREMGASQVGMAFA